MGHEESEESDCRHGCRADSRSDGASESVFRGELSGSDVVISIFRVIRRPILASVPVGVTRAQAESFVEIPLKMDAQRELDEGQDEADGGNDKTEHVQKSGGKSSETERKMSELHPNANCRKQNKTFTNKTNFSTAHAFLF
jgi:hypothetical protein